jgi:hypothetical protein
VRSDGKGALAVSQGAPLSTAQMGSAVLLPRFAGQDGRLTGRPVVAGLRAVGGIMAPGGDVALRASGERKPKRQRGNDGHDQPYAPIAMMAHVRQHSHTPYTPSH